MDWAPLFPHFLAPGSPSSGCTQVGQLVKDVEVADIGCGFGGLLAALGPLLPETLMLGGKPIEASPVTLCD